MDHKIRETLGTKSLVLNCPDLYISIIYLCE